MVTRSSPSNRMSRRGTGPGGTRRSRRGGTRRSQRDQPDDVCDRHQSGRLRGSLKCGRRSARTQRPRRAEEQAHAVENRSRSTPATCCCGTQVWALRRSHDPGGDAGEHGSDDDDQPQPSGRVHRPPTAKIVPAIGVPEGPDERSTALRSPVTTGAGTSSAGRTTRSVLVIGDEPPVGDVGEAGQCVAPGVRAHAIQVSRSSGRTCSSASRTRPRAPAPRRRVEMARVKPARRTTAAQVGGGVFHVVHRVDEEAPSAWAAADTAPVHLGRRGRNDEAHAVEVGRVEAAVHPVDRLPPRCRERIGRHDRDPGRQHPAARAACSRPPARLRPRARDAPRASEKSERPTPDLRERTVADGKPPEKYKSPEGSGPAGLWSFGSCSAA